LLLASDLLPLEEQGVALTEGEKQKLPLDAASPLHQGDFVFIENLQ
jgi:hypothetical protein